MAASAALCFSGGSFAEDTAGGGNAFKNALGGLNAPVIASGIIAGGIVAGIVSNNRGIAKEIVVIVPPPVDPTCNGSDPLVDGVCTGTTTTVTVTGTGTMTVPVTFTYAPSV